MLRHILPHKLAQYLGRRLILRSANLQKLLAQIALNPDSETNILHGVGVYPMDTRFGSLKW